MQWLANKDCKGLFSANYDPSAVLRSLLKDGAFTNGASQIRFFTVNLLTSLIGGVTTPNLTYSFGYFGVFVGADITINTVGSPDKTEAAETVIEELGHAYNVAFGMGGPQIVSDGLGSGTYKYGNATVDGSTYNRLLIMANCNK